MSYTNAVRGTLLSILVCFCIFYITERNLTLSIYATVAIAAIILNILSFLNLFDWGLSTMLSTSLIIFVGISFDFVIHISHEYLQAPFSDRERRVQHALSQMGTTVTGGTLTSGFAAAALLTCQSDGLYRIGAMLMVTIISAFLVATFFLPAFLCIAGPETNV